MPIIAQQGFRGHYLGPSWPPSCTRTIHYTVSPLPTYSLLWHPPLGGLSSKAQGPNSALPCALLRCSELRETSRPPQSACRRPSPFSLCHLASTHTFNCSEIALMSSVGRREAGGAGSARGGASSVSEPKVPKLPAVQSSEVAPVSLVEGGRSERKAEGHTGGDVDTILGSMIDGKGSAGKGVRTVEETKSPPSRTSPSSTSDMIEGSTKDSENVGKRTTKRSHRRNGSSMKQPRRTSTGRSSMKVTKMKKRRRAQLQRAESTTVRSVASFSAACVR